jgi:polar amino acid transport system substrate-binding protein
MLVLAVILTLILSACGQSAPEEAAVEEQDMITGITERGIMKVGVGVFIPWSFKDKDGNLVGYEIDVATKLAEDMGVDIEFVPTDWAGIIPALLTSKFDLIIAGMGITTERAMKVNFTNPYEYSGLEVICSKANAPDITSIEDMNSEDMILALGVDGTPLFWAEDNLPKAEIRNFAEHEAQVQDILNGNSKCSLTNPPKYYRDVRDNPDELYMPFGVDYFGKEPMAFALPKGDPDAVFFFNSWITNNETFLTERAEYWFASTDWEYLLPEDAE